MIVQLRDKVMSIIILEFHSIKKVEEGKLPNTIILDNDVEQIVLPLRDSEYIKISKNEV